MKNSDAELQTGAELALAEAIGNLDAVDGQSVAGLLTQYLDATISSRSSHADPHPNGYIDAPISGAGASQSDIEAATKLALSDDIDGYDPEVGSLADIVRAIADNNDLTALDATDTATDKNTQSELRDASEWAIGADIGNLAYSVGSVADILEKIRANNNLSGLDATATDKNTTAELRDPVETQIGSLNPENGSIANYIANRMDAAISTRSSHNWDPNGRIDATVSSRATPADVDFQTLNQSDILSDGTPISGADIDAAISSRAAPADTIDWGSKTPRIANGTANDTGGEAVNVSGSGYLTGVVWSNDDDLNDPEIIIDGNVINAANAYKWGQSSQEESVTIPLQHRFETGFIVGLQFGPGTMDATATYVLD